MYCVVLYIAPCCGALCCNVWTCVVLCCTVLVIPEHLFLFFSFHSLRCFTLFFHFYQHLTTPFPLLSPPSLPPSAPPNPLPPSFPYLPTLYAYHHTYPPDTPGLWGSGGDKPRGTSGPKPHLDDPSGMYRFDRAFLAALRSADLTCYTYGAPRIGTPNFCQVWHVGWYCVVYCSLHSLPLKCFVLF